MQRTVRSCLAKLLLTVCLLVSASISAFGSPVPGSTGVRPRSAPTPVTAEIWFWERSCIDCPRTFADAKRYLQLDASGHPHIAYGGDHLYHTWHDGNAWLLETVDDAPGVGACASMAFDGYGAPHVSYYDSYNGALKYARKVGDTWQVETVVSDVAHNLVGMYTAIDLDSADLPHITYHVRRSGMLKYARRSGGAWQIESIDEVGTFPAAAAPIAIDGSDSVHVAYLDRRTGGRGVKYARRSGSAWEIEIVAPLQYANGDSVSLAVQANGTPHVTYYDDNDLNLKHARRTGDVWDMMTVDATRFAGFTANSLVLDVNEYPHVAYAREGNTFYAYWTGSAWQRELVSAATHVPKYASLTLDGDGSPHLAFRNYAELYYGQRTASGWDVEMLDSARTAGPHVDLALAGDGIAHVAYATSRSPFAECCTDLHYARQDGDTWSRELVNTTGSMGTYNSLDVDSWGVPHISSMAFEFEGSHGEVVYARRDAAAWRVSTVANAVDAAGTAAVYTSLALDSGGKPHISYHYNEEGGAEGDLKYARWSGSRWEVGTVDSQGNTGLHNSLALDSAGRAHISYLDATADTLKYASWTGSRWNVETVDSIGNSLGALLLVRTRTSLALDSTGRPHIAYVHLDGFSIRYALWTGNSWEIETIGAGESPSLALDSADVPHITHYGGRALVYTTKIEGTWVSQTVDMEGQVGQYNSLVVDSNDVPHIGYYDYSNEDLKYAVGKPLSRVWLPLSQR